MPDKEPADAQASYRATDTAARIGPRVELYAVALPDGRTAVSALAWQIDESAKPAADRVTGTVGSVTGTYSDPAGTPQTGTVAGSRAQQLAADFNDLLMSSPTEAAQCPSSAPLLTLVFHTSNGEKSVRDACGYLTLSPPEAAPLEATDAFDLDVNRDFQSLMPEPLASSAPLPTVAASATLVVGIDVVGGPLGTPSDVAVAGTVSLVRDGVRAGGGAVVKGQTLRLKVAPGTYQVSASPKLMHGMVCRAPATTAYANRATDLTVICNIK